MANKRIDELDAVTSLADSANIAIVTSSTTFKTTLGDLKTHILGDLSDRVRELELRKTPESSVYVLGFKNDSNVSGNLVPAVDKFYPDEGTINNDISVALSLSGGFYKASVTVNNNSYLISHLVTRLQGGDATYVNNPIVINAGSTHTFEHQVGAHAKIGAAQVVAVKI